jgi:CRISPR-associated protein Cmr1
VRDEEWALLDLTLRLIADYGAMGGKTVYKPSSEPGRANKTQHKDHGIIQTNQLQYINTVPRKKLESYVGDKKWDKGEKNSFAWASLNNFWCVKGRTLTRECVNKSSFNRVIGRKEEKRQSKHFIKGNKKWLAGDTGESKKVFSFKSPPRTFGFVKPGIITHDQMKNRLREAWLELKNEEYSTDAAILTMLLKNEEASHDI